MCDHTCGQGLVGRPHPHSGHRQFTKSSPSAGNVFGMTRFPHDDDVDGPDPVAACLAVTGDALDRHGLRFLLASQRALVDDLWGNVAAHMWSSNYGIAFFEDRRGRGMNYNLVIEVGACSWLDADACFSRTPQSARCRRPGWVHLQTRRPRHARDHHAGSTRMGTGRPDSRQLQGLPPSGR